MPVAPDIDYYLMGAEEFCQLGVDAAFYYRYLAEDTNQFVDGYDRSKRTFRYRRHMDTLRDMGAYCEERFVRWRQANPEEAPACSQRVCDSLSGQLENWCHETAMGLVNHGHFTMTRRARHYMDGRLEFDASVAVMKRAAMRAYHDLDGYRDDTMLAARRLCDQIFERVRRENELDRDAALARIRWDEQTDFDYGAEPLPLHKDGVYIPRPPPPAVKRRRIRLRRAVAKRSIRLAERFVGAESVRLFVGGDAMEITGQLAVYKIKRRRGLLSAHGGADLEVYALDGVTKLCRLCIYTSKVPLLDHVLSLILHIRSGQEEHILTVGNAYDITEAARETEWLKPYLPRKVSTGIDLVNMAHLPPAYREDDREIRIAQMRREVSEIVLDRLGRYCPAMPQTLALLASGLPRREFIASQEGLQFFGEMAEPALVGLAGGGPVQINHAAE